MKSVQVMFAAGLLAALTATVAFARGPGGGMGHGQMGNAGQMSSQTVQEQARQKNEIKTQQKTQEQLKGDPQAQVRERTEEQVREEVKTGK